MVGRKRPVGLLLGLGLALAGCGPGKPAGDQGLALRQIVVVGAAGTAPERRLELFEDARITPALRRLMWGGSKDPAWLLAQPGITLDPAVRSALLQSGFRRGLLRLVDRDGKVLAERRLDCELGEIAEPALPQGSGGLVWGIGDDCSTGGGDFAGLITRFLPPPGDRLAFEGYRDPASGESGELTLVTAARIRWHLVPHGVADEVHEVSAHPDFDDPRFKALRSDQAPPPDLPWAVDYLTYRWDGAGTWLRSLRTERPARWSAAEAWPAEAAFPPAALSPSDPPRAP